MRIYHDFDDSWAFVLLYRFYYIRLYDFAPINNSHTPNISGYGVNEKPGPERGFERSGLRRATDALDKWLVVPEYVAGAYRENNRHKMLTSATN